MSRTGLNGGYMVTHTADIDMCYGPTLAGVKDAIERAIARGVPAEARFCKGDHGWLAQWETTVWDDPQAKAEEAQAFAAFMAGWSVPKDA